MLAAAFAPGTTSDATRNDRLAALFRRRPEAASDAAALLSKNGVQKRLTNSLGAAGSPAAIAALVKLATNPALSENLRVDSIAAFVQVQHPTPAIMRVPADLMRDPNPLVRSAARLMSGAVARAGRSLFPDEANAIDASLVALYSEAQVTPEAVELLSALGNSAGPSVVPIIENALHDSRVPVRAAAARAFRLVPGPEIDHLLASVIATDSDPAVRGDALFAARFRRPLPGTLADAALDSATADSVDYVRSDAIALILQNPTISPHVAKTLAFIADHDSNPGIRRQASEALASISSPSKP